MKHIQILQIIDFFELFVKNAYFRELENTNIKYNYSFMNQ